MTLTTNYVYKIRSRGAAASERPAPHTNGTPVLVSKAARGLSRRGAQAAPASGQEERFVALVLDVGLSRAAALLDQLRHRVQGLAVH